MYLITLILDQFFMIGQAIFSIVVYLEDDKLVIHDSPTPIVFWIFIGLVLLTALTISAGVILILKVQIINFFTGQTTNERFGTRAEEKHISNFDEHNIEEGN